MIYLEEGCDQHFELAAFTIVVQNRALITKENVEASNREGRTDILDILCPGSLVPSGSPL